MSLTDIVYILQMYLFITYLSKRECNHHEGTDIVIICLWFLHTCFLQCCSPNVYDSGWPIVGTININLMKVFSLYEQPFEILTHSVEKTKTEKIYKSDLLKS